MSELHDTEQHADDTLFVCPQCGTNYLEPGECDWCPGVRLIEEEA